jgi:hypothetical protein
MDPGGKQSISWKRNLRHTKRLALFLSKEEVKKHVPMRDREGLIRPTYYKDRMREARKLVRELRKST